MVAVDPGGILGVFPAGILGVPEELSGIEELDDLGDDCKAPTVDSNEVVFISGLVVELGMLELEFELEGRLLDVEDVVEDMLLGFADKVDSN